MKVFPVIHVVDDSVALEQAALAFSYGADGVYLIAHGGGTGSVMGAFGLIDERFADAYIGINLLELSTCGALQAIVRAVESGTISRVPDGLWSDDIRSDSDPFEAMRLKCEFPILSSVRVLGGVAFKYTPTFTEDPVRAAAEVRSLSDAVDVVTTSGAGTGTPPTAAKLKAMSGATDKPLAVASGVASENLAELGPWIDEVLVASSIETEPYSGILDPARLLAFMRQASRIGH